MNIAPFYDGWRIAQERLVERISELSSEELSLRAAPNLWPIWAITAHTAAVRPYWLCHICKEPGAERTPFAGFIDYGWEDELDHPRDASELVPALESTWTIVEECLDRWTPEMLQDEFRREINGQLQIHTRQGVLMRLLTHDAYHIGEITQTLGVNGLPEIYIWTSRVLASSSS